MRRGRNGTVTDLPVIMIVLTGLAITVVIASLVLDTVIGATTSSMINQEVLMEAQSALSVYNYGVMFVAVGMFTVSILFAWRIRTSPIYAVPSILFLSMSVWLSSEIANIFTLFSSANSQVSGVVANYPGIQLLFNNFPTIFAVMGGIMLIALYIRRDRAGGEVSV